MKELVYLALLRSRLARKSGVGPQRFVGVRPDVRESLPGEGGCRVVVVDEVKGRDRGSGGPKKFDREKMMIRDDFHTMKDTIAKKRRKVRRGSGSSSAPWMGSFVA